jgi:predicted transcriptional regulator
MPRMGSTKAGKAAAPATVAHDLMAAIEQADMKPMGDLIRESQERAVVETLETIKKIQTQTRDASGKIKRAKLKAGVLALRWEGFSPRDTARILGVSEAVVSHALLQLRKDASLDEQITRIDTLIVPLAVDNLARGILAGDKEYTLRVLDGRGLLRAYKSIEGNVTKRNLNLTIVTTMPAGVPEGTIPIVKPGGVMGAPLRGEKSLPDIVTKAIPAAVETGAVARGIVGVPDSL